MVLKRSCWLAIALFLMAFVLHAQRGAIRGKVLDGKTNQVLPFANVYFNYTSIGTSTDKNGEFVLTAPAGTYELVVSFVGFKSHQGKVKIADNETKEFTIRLAPSIMAEVQIRSTRDREWKRQLERFKKMFFGNSVNTSQCAISNTWVLDFKEDADGTLSATALAPLYIENLGLGYKLFYQLNRFSVGPKHFVISGTVRFDEMKSSDTTLTRMWLANRQTAYRGSQRHLFKAMIDQRLKEEGFAVFEDISNNTDISRNSTFLSNLGKNIADFSLDGRLSTIEADREFKINLPNRIEVHYAQKDAPASVYRTVPHPISWIEVPRELPLVNEQGVVVNPASITVLGAWSDSRVADILPYDFEPTASNKVEVKPRASKWKSLLEKPYVHTDKSYYYPGETIWLKVYMKYDAPAMKDSLSRVLYMDIVKPDLRILTTKVFAIENGMVAASIKLPAALRRGDYQLRAYTRWSRNFSDQLVFTKPLKILDDLETVSNIEIKPTSDSTRSFRAATDNTQYTPREKISLTIESKDFYDRWEGAQLSVSVTDAEQVVPPANETTILQSFSIPEMDLPDTLSIDPNLFIQTGIDLKGQFITKRKKPERALIKLVQENTADAFVITTQEQGLFSVTGLLLYDSVKLLVEGKTVKGKRAGKVHFDSVSFTPPLTAIEPLEISLLDSQGGLRSHLFDETEQPAATLLEEVIIKATKEAVPSKSAPHPAADFQIKGDWLVESNSYDVLQSLRSRVPGIRISYVLQNGVARKYLSFGITSFQNGTSNEPLLIIDGVAMTRTDEGDLTVAERISYLSPYEVESIEVIKFGGAAAYGARGGNGVIVITTRKTPPRVKAIQYDKTKMQTLRVAGFSSFSRFTSPNYSPASDPSRKDYRSVIYWNPNVQLTEKGPVTLDFYAADLPTTYRIVVEGVSATGAPLRYETYVAVKK